MIIRYFPIRQQLPSMGEVAPQVPEGALAEVAPTVSLCHPPLCGNPSCGFTAKYDPRRYIICAPHNHSSLLINRPASNRPVPAYPWSSMT